MKIKSFFLIIDSTTDLSTYNLHQNKCISYAEMFCVSRMDLIKTRDFRSRVSRACLVSTTCRAYPLSNLQGIWYTTSYRTSFYLAWSAGAPSTYCVSFLHREREREKYEKEREKDDRSVVLTVYWLPYRFSLGQGGSQESTIKQSPNTFMILSQGQCTRLLLCYYSDHHFPRISFPFWARL